MTLAVSEGIKMVGRVQVFTRRRSKLHRSQGAWTLAAESPNLIVTDGKVHVAKMLADVSGFDTGLTWIEVGTGTAAPALADVALATPHVRKAVIADPIVTANVVQYRAFFASADISVDLKETGIFGHSTATSTNGTGELFARALLTFNNNADPHDATFVWTVTFG